jgi:ribosomal protein S18 acetylase RimI-like enzyme
VIELPDGYAARPASMADADGVAALIAACELEDDGEVEVDAGDMRSSWERQSFDPGRDAVIVELGGEPAGWAQVFKARRAEADVHPHHRGRGIGSALLAWTERRAQGSGGALVGQTVTDASAGAARLFEARGYGPLWTAWILRIALDRDPPRAPAPQRIAIRAYRSPDDDRPTFDLIERAFSEWPDREPETFEDWAPWMVGHPAFAPLFSRVAVDGDRIVGVALSLDYGAGNEGWIQQLAVERAYRRRGIARALLASAFASFRERGASACGLSTDSRTGALGLYERVGMRVRRSYTHWAKSLVPSD